jgi:hypothetical protein
LEVRWEVKYPIHGHRYFFVEALKKDKLFLRGRSWGKSIMMGKPFDQAANG